MKVSSESFLEESAEEEKSEVRVLLAGGHEELF